MSREHKGHSVPLSVPRRLIGDLLHFARQVPSVPVQRRMSLGPLMAARRGSEPRPSWVALFTKALALVAAENPRLRQAYLSFPWPRLYQYPESVASVAVERDWHGEEVVFFGQLRAPDRQTVAELDAHLRRYRTTPITEVPSFRKALRVSRLWRPLRRLGWWYALNVSGENRSHYFGTFAVSVYSALGVESLHPISPLTTLLNYGPISPEGQVDVRIIYDHRVLDGATVARALLRLEAVLCGPMVAELGGTTLREKGAA
jgi:hypothetical protein